MLISPSMAKDAVTKSENYIQEKLQAFEIYDTKFKESIPEKEEPYVWIEMKKLANEISDFCVGLSDEMVENLTQLWEICDLFKYPEHEDGDLKNRCERIVEQIVVVDEDLQSKMNELLVLIPSIAGIWAPSSKVNFMKKRDRNLGAENE